MTPAEAVALRWVEKHVHVLDCDRCGGRWIVEKSKAVLFHKCRSPIRRVRPYRGVEETNAVKDRAWAEKTLGLKPIAEAIEAAVGGPDAWYTEEEE